MPRTKRDRMKRLAGHELHCLETAGERIEELYAYLEEQHPEYEEPVKEILTGIAMCKILSQAMFTKIWGEVPKKVQRWRTR